MASSPSKFNIDLELLDFLPRPRFEPMGSLMSACWTRDLLSNGFRSISPSSAVIRLLLPLVGSRREPVLRCTMSWPMVERSQICLTTCVFHLFRQSVELLTVLLQIIAASPYTAPIYEYSAALPTGNYEDFADLAGCGQGSSGLNKYSSVFDCLVAADSDVLQNASGTVSTTRGYFGSFAFVPVIDGDYIQERPSLQLSHGEVSGKRILVGVGVLQPE